MGWTTNQAADYLGVKREYIARLCKNGVLKAMMHGRDWDIDPDSVKAHKEKPVKRGRPKKLN